ncbi:MAG TPA: DeoR/GlpR family DNA-binding transcription regulator [Solirubrobacteraceae bacterium]|jgi:DeoR/GlpR family transcriptional regulator of sugar metabolism|nr:DeoR/GlpR family DNA-binding transcription regulator [Solirubrobacteraceae bacterium]
MLVVHAVDRRHRILERVAEEQTIHITELASELGVSEMTIRRDIGRLERDGFLRRTYGGATAHITRSMELLFNARALANAPMKRRLGMRVAETLETAATIFIGIGSTAEQFAMFLPASAERTVITGSLPVASLLGTRQARVVVLGGSVLNDDLACVGPVAAATVRRYHADVAVLGAAGVSAANGITELDDSAAEIQRLMIEQSARLTIVADGSKIGATTMAGVAPASAIHTLVTDAGAPPDELRALAALGIEVVVLDAEGETERDVTRPTARQGEP